MRRTITNLLARKLVTVPRLSPTHTSARLVKVLVPTGTDVIDYQPVMTLQCSPDLIADPADRVTNDYCPTMLLETSEEGKLKWNSNVLDNIAKGKWYDVGTIIGEIIDEDEDVDEEDDNKDWMWQAYLHEDHEKSNEEKD